MKSHLPEGKNRPSQAGQLVESETLEQVLKKVMEKMFSEMQEMLSEQIRCCFSEYAQAFSLDAVRIADNLVRVMKAFAFGMGE